jgi:hypothetical protein
MKIFRTLVFVCIATFWQGAAFSGAHAGEDASTQEQRRAELRAALKVRNGHGSVDPDTALAPIKPPLKRHLSDLERADLRQQLRQQRHSSKSDRP